MSLFRDGLTLPGTAVPYGTNHSRPSKSASRIPQSNGGFFAPLHQFASNPGKTLSGIANDVENQADAKTAIKDNFEARRQILYFKQRTALTFEEWESAAKELDELEGNDVWKVEPESDEYNADLVQERLEQLNEARINCDVRRMLFLIRTSLTRHLGGMGNLKLYKHSHIGTKNLIERYIDSALETIDKLLEISGSQTKNGLDPKYLLEELLRSRQSFGRSALLLSGGGTFGMNHVGVMRCLWENNLLPRIISGASAGSIIAATICTRTDEQLQILLRDFAYGDFQVFEKTGEEDSVLTKVGRFLKYGSLFDISHLKAVMRKRLGEVTFQEAYNRTRRILNITVSSADLYELPRLLNYVTAPNVIIWSAVCASCSVPLIFTAAPLLAKDPRTGEAVPWNPSPQVWIDGSVDNDLPMTRLAEMFNVNHFIVSQVNPHVVPFLRGDEDSIASESNQPSTSAFGTSPGWLHSMTSFAKSEVLHRMHVVAEMGVLPTTLTKLRSVLNQKYSGDITILPEIPFAHFPLILANPTPKFMEETMLGGERATWPKLSRIQNHCAIELALDDAVARMRARVAFSPSQVDLRMNAMVRPLSRSRSDNAKNRLRARRRRSHDFKPCDRLGLGLRRETDIGFLRQQLSSSSVPKSPSFKPSLQVTGPYETRLVSPEHRDNEKHATFEAEAVVSSTPPDTDSSESEAESSLTDTPPSPEPKSWMHRRNPFHWASQPFLTPQRRGTATPSPSSSGAATPGLVMTLKTAPLTTTAPSAPEMTYKRIFHGASASCDSAFPSVADTAPPSPKFARTGRASETARDLSIDIPSPDGIVVRKKRSNSTGMRRLAPPRRR